MDTDMNRISDLDIYLTRMQRSILDKMFFIDKVFEPFKYILDFGCANGELIKAMKPMFPDYEYSGYDISREMIESRLMKALSISQALFTRSIPTAQKRTSTCSGTEFSAAVSGM